MHKQIQKLVQDGWKVKENGVAFDLPASLRQRYTRIPQELCDVLSGLQECVAPDEKSWLICLPDYCEQTNSAFAWNEFERQSLEAASGDESWQCEIRNFWDRHLPIFMSVRNGYEYVAVSLNEETFGQVVTGFEPAYEETTEAAKTVSEFLVQLTKQK